ncbi:MAG: hypothetical protein WDZ49_09480 [Litorilinea sp.]
MISNFRGRHKPQNSHRIFTDTGKIAGFVSGHVFDKRIDSQRHVFRHPFKRIAFDVSTLERAQHFGADTVRVSFFDIGDVLTAPIARILADGRAEKSFGFGRQISWPYALFVDENAPKPQPEPKQPSLFDAMEVA